MKFKSEKVRVLIEPVNNALSGHKIIMKRSKVKGKCLIKIKTMPEMISYPKATVAFDFVFGKKH